MLPTATHANVNYDRVSKPESCYEDFKNSHQDEGAQTVRDKSVTSNDTHVCRTFYCETKEKNKESSLFFSVSLDLGKGPMLLLDLVSSRCSEEYLYLLRRACF